MLNKSVPDRFTRLWPLKHAVKKGWKRKSVEWKRRRGESKTNCSLANVKDNVKNGNESNDNSSPGAHPTVADNVLI
jgi:hypothetical protein